MVDIPSGKRSPIIGFVMELCKVLMTCCEESNQEVYNASLKQTLGVRPVCTAVPQAGTQNCDRLCGQGACRVVLSPRCLYCPADTTMQLQQRLCFRAWTVICTLQCKSSC